MGSALAALGRLVRGFFVAGLFVISVAFSTAVLAPFWFFAFLFGNEFLGLTYPVVDVGLVAAVGAATGAGGLPLVVGDVPVLYPAVLALATALYFANPFTVSVGGSSSESGISVGGVHFEYETDLDDGAEGGDFGDGGDFGGGFDGGGGGGGGGE